MSIKNLASKLFSLGILFLIVTSISEVTYLWENAFYLIIPARRFLIIPGLIFIASALILNKFNIKDLKYEPIVYGLGVVFLFISDWFYNDYGFLQAPSIRGTILLLAIVIFPFYFNNKKINWSLISIISIAFLIVNFLLESEGRIIFSDDHSTFLHRLILLKDNFPNIPIYDPLWNGGYDQRYFFATGALNYFFLTLPITYFFDPEIVYNYCFIFIVFVLPPIITYLSARIAKVSVETSWIATILSLSVGFLWYRWCLQYGTMGFIVSTILVPLNIVLSARIVNVKEKTPLVLALLFAISFTLMLFWSASGLVFIPIILLGIWKILRNNLLKHNHVKLIIALLLTLNVPWIVSFWSVSNVSKFIVAEESATSTDSTKEYVNNRSKKFKHKTEDIDLVKVVNEARSNLSTFNPLMIIFVIPGLFLLKRAYRLPFMLTLSWLLFLGTFCVKLKPQLELDRMLIILFMSACIPSALAIKKLFEDVNANSTLSRLFKLSVVTLTAATLISMPISVSSIIKRRTTNYYNFSDKLSKDLINTISSYKNNNSRVIFTGCIIHEIDGGHIAPLTEFTEVPIIASSPVHNLWWYKQIFPPEFISRRDEGKEEYMDLYNVSVVFAHEPKWREYFKQRSDKYKFIKQINSFSVFERLNYTPNYFLKGKGKILEQTNHSVKLQMHSDNAVIKFNYFPFLESDFCTLSEEKISDSVSFVKISECKKGTTLSIKSKPAWKRIKF